MAALRAAAGAVGAVGAHSACGAWPWRCRLQIPPRAATNTRFVCSGANPRQLHRQTRGVGGVGGVGLMHTLRDIDANIPPTVWLDRCCEHAAAHPKDAIWLANLAGAWFEQKVFFAPPAQSPTLGGPTNAKNLLGPRDLTRVQDILLGGGNLTAYSKCVRYHIEQLRETHQWKELNALRQKSRLAKFKHHARTLGAQAVIDNGMFAKFHFPHNTKYTLQDFEFLSQGLAAELAPGGQLTLQNCVILMEKMHGFHTRRHRTAYSMGLAPNVQMARMLACSLRRRPNDEALREEYRGLLEDMDQAQRREQRPKPQSSGQRARRVTLPNLFFGKLPLNILLRAIAIGAEKGLKSNLAPHETALRLFRTMLRTRNVHPNQDTLCVLLRLLHREPALRKGIPMLLSSFSRHCPQNDATRATLRSLGYDPCGNIKIAT